MKYCIDQLLNNITEQMSNSTGNKILIRVDSFENPFLYFELWKKLKVTCDNKNINFIFKLSEEKYNDFLRKAQFSFVLSELRNNELIAFNEKLTAYRNLTPINKTLIVLVGTEVSEESGSLDDFYAINIQVIEQTIKNRYSHLFDKYDFMSDDACKVIDNVYTQLFKYVPQNILNLSDFVDQLPMGYDNIEELVDEIFSSLHKYWNFVDIVFLKPSISELRKGKKINILEQADKFLKRKKYDSVSEVEKNKNKIRKYIAAKQEGGIDWPMCYEIKSYDEFADTIFGYMEGINIESNREKLATIDFSIICEALQFKLKDKGTTTKDKISSFKDEPIITIMKSILDYIYSYNISSDNFNGCINYKIQSISIAQAVTEDEVKSIWSNLCYVTGGLIPYINQQEIVLGDDIDLVITEDKDYFNIDTMDVLINDGVLSKSSAAQSLCKIKFELSNNEIGKKEYVWEFSSRDEWLVLFEDLRAISTYTQSVPFIPYGVCDKIDTICDVRNSTEFYDTYSKLNVHYDKANIIEEYERQYGTNYEAYYLKFYKIGDEFSKAVNAIMSNGFYSCINTNIYPTFKAYTDYADYILNHRVTEQLEQSYKLFINAFIISDTINPIKQDVEVNTVIIPPYHPAVLEKLYYRNDYIKFGMHGLLSGCIDSKSDNNVVHLINKVDRIIELAKIDSAVDILLSQREYLTKSSIYGYYTTYINKNCMLGNTGTLNDILVRDGVLGEDLNTKEYKTLTPIGRILRNNVINYTKAFPLACHSLKIVAINFYDFQDIVSAIHNLLLQLNKSQNVISEVTLKILMPITQQGGKNYLSYWVNTFFDEDSDVNIKIYLNYYENQEQISNLVGDSNDIVFFNDVLKETNVTVDNSHTIQYKVTDTKFPMVYRSLPVSITSKKRNIEITQTQFEAATKHSNVVYKCKNRIDTIDSTHLVIREMTMNNSECNILETLHSKAKWIVCIGMGLDKKILLDNQHRDYKIIGFTTGEGTYGEYNVTTSACTSMVDDLKTKLKMKFGRIFNNSGDDIIAKSVDNCISKARYLDGISLLKALNPRDYDINNFLSYLLTDKYFIQNNKSKNTINILVPLDSYQHWFGNDNQAESNLRPDFLQLIVNNIGNDNESEILNISANIIECKLAKVNEQHVTKALTQVKHGYDVLSNIFDPTSDSIERRYWYAQLYRVLTFTEINILDNEEGFSLISNKLMKVLDGQFNIEWTGSIMTYWIDSPEEDIIITPQESNSLIINQYAFGQQRILKDLSGDEMLMINYNDNIMLDLADEEKDEIFDEFPIDLQEKFIDVETSNHKQVDIQKQYEMNEDTDNNVVDRGVQDIKSKIILNDNEIININESDIEVAVAEQNNFSNSYKICLGNSTTQEERVFWDFKDTTMSNRHILITGKSGQGKTYAIQGMFLELAKKGIPVIIFDYTGGFVHSKLEPEVVKQLDGKINQQVVRRDKLKINPFKLQTMDMDGITIPEDSVDVAERIKDILVHVYDFGDQQAATVYMACKNGLDKYKNEMNFDHFKDELLALGTKEAKSVHSKIISFLDYDIFDTKNESNWDDIVYSDGNVTIFQLSFVQSKDMQIAITEMILWDMWYYTVKNGSEAKPFAVVLDEAQNLSFGDKAPTTKILTEGRKFGWSGWFATQFLKGQLKSEEINRLQQAALRIYFKPADDEIQSMANSIDPEKKDISRWITQLKRAQKGECVIIGDGVYSSRGIKKINPVTIRVPRIEDRL